MVRYVAHEVLPAWTPGESCFVWLDAAQGIALDEGGNVSQWSDQSGSGHHLIQSVAAKRPTLVNGCVRFDGVDDYLTANGLAHNNATLVLHMVVSIPAATFYGRYFSATDATNPDYLGLGGFLLYNDPGVAGVNASIYRNSVAYYGASLTANAPTLVTVAFTASVIRIYKNTVLAVEHVVSGGAFNIQQIALGASVDGSSNTPIDMSEMLLYSSQTEGERESTQSHLMEKHNIT